MIIAPLLFTITGLMARSSPQTPDSTPAPGSVLADPRLTFARAVDDFGRRVRSMPPDQAAREWLDLVRRGASIPTDRRRPGFTRTSVCLDVLPSPDAWPKIAAIADDAGPELAPPIKLLMTILQGKNEEALQLVRQMKTGASATVAKGLKQIELELAVRLRDADTIEQVLLDTPPVATRRRGSELTVPGLVAIVGSDRAAKILRRLLSHVKGELVFPKGSSDTEALALRIAKEHVDQLAFPQWRLSVSPDAGDLFEQMATRFAALKFGALEWQSAVACLVNLWSSGDEAGARSFAEKHVELLKDGFVSSSGHKVLLYRLADSGRLDAFARFLGDLATTNPGSPLADLFASFAEYGASPSLVESVARSGLAKDPALRQPEMELAFLHALLAQGKYSDAATELLQNRLQDFTWFQHETDGKLPRYLNNAELFKQLGHLLHRPDLVKIGDERASANAKQFPSLVADQGDLSKADLAEIERVLKNDLQDSFTNPLRNSPPSNQTALTSLARFYSRLGRNGDVIELLDNDARWESSDLRYVQLGHGPGAKFAPIALSAAGRNQEALRLVRFSLESNPYDDDAYELLVKLGWDNAGSTLEALAREFPLNGRPVIWRAEWLRRKGRLAEAKAVGEKGLSMDPMEFSVFGPYTKFLGQIVLAKTDEKLGDPTGAARIDRYSRATHLLAEAEDLFDLHLDLPSVALYREVIELVPDYVPARYALGELEMRDGNIADGAKDLDLAMRALPPKVGSSFGLRLGMNEGPAQAKLAALNSLHTLLSSGQANATMWAFAAERDAELGNEAAAFRENQRAVELDPDCLVAWLELAYASQSRPDGLHERAIANCIRLGGASARWDLGAVRDYAAAWYDLTSMPPRLFGPQDSIFPLNTSLKAPSDSTPAGNSSDVVSQFARGRDPAPGMLIADDPLILPIGILLDKEAN